MVRRLVPLVLLVFLVAPLTARSGPADPQANPSQARSRHMREGVRHFDRAFYELTPRKRQAEAAREYEQAIAEFEAELRERPASVEPHKYLGRIFTARKQFRDAAHHFDELSDLEPGSVDACVQAAVAYTQAGQMEDARLRLLKAKGRTTDAGALARLDEYLAKLDRRPPVPLP